MHVSFLDDALLLDSVGRFVQAAPPETNLFSVAAAAIFGSVRGDFLLEEQQ